MVVVVVVTVMVVVVLWMSDARIFSLSNVDFGSKMSIADDERRAQIQIFNLACARERATFWNLRLACISSVCSVPSSRRSWA
jgi:hypothetical protein